MKKNILWVLVSRVGTQGLAVLLTILLARRLGSVGFGEYAFIAAAVFLGNALTTFGTDMLLIREIAGRDDRSQLPAALAIQLTLSVLFIAAVWLGAGALPQQSPEAVQGLRIYSLALLPLAFFSVFTTALRGMQRMDAYMALNLAASVLQVAAVLSVRPGGSGTPESASLFSLPLSGVPALAAALLAAQVAAALFGGLLCAAQIPGFWRAWHVRLDGLLALLRASAPIALISLVSILYQKLPVYLAATLTGPAPTGWLSAALRVVEAAKTAHLAVFTALYPAMAQAASAAQPEPAAQTINEREGHPPAGTGTPGMQGIPWQGRFGRSWKLLLAGAAAAALALFFLAAPAARLLYGPEYTPSILALRILAWMLVPFTINTFQSLALLAAHRERTVMRVQLLGLVTLAALNAWWIPRWGLSGACFALLAAEMAQAVGYLGDAVTRRGGDRETGDSLAAGVVSGNPGNPGSHAPRGNPFETLRVFFRFFLHIPLPRRDAERRGMGSHAERGNQENRLRSPSPLSEQPSDNGEGAGGEVLLRSPPCLFQSIPINTHTHPFSARKISSGTGASWDACQTCPTWRACCSAWNAACPGGCAGRSRCRRRAA